jgi:WD40 repeat protein
VPKRELGTRATAPAAAAPETPPAAPAPKPEPVKEMPAKAMTAEAAAAERLLTYDEHVFPIFEEACITCHDPVDASGGLDLSTHAAVLQGGGSGRTLRPGQPDGSRLYLLVSHREKPTMPPDEPRIAAERIETIRLWIAQGAPKDRAQAERLAAERAAERARAAAEAAAGDTATAAAPVVMPEALPPLAKAWPRRPGALRAVAASPSAPLCAVPGFGQVLLYQADELRELGVLAFPFGQVERLAFSADGALLLAAGGTSGRIGGAVVYDVRSGAERGRFAEQGDTVLGADLSPDGRLVAVGGTRRRVEVFALDGGAAVWQGPHDDWVTAVAFSSDSALLASADRAGNVLVREAPNGREVHALTGHEGAVTSIAFRPGGDLLATAGVDRTVRAFRLRDGVQAWSETAHGDQVLCLTWASPSRLLSGGADGRVLHWQADGKRDPELPRLGEWVYGLAALDQGARVLAADWGGRLSVLDPKSRKLLAELVPLALVE